MQGRTEKPHFTIILAVGIPASGKSSIFKQAAAQLSAKDWFCQLVSSDDIRAQIMDRLVAKGISRDEAFNRSTKQTNSKFDADINATMEEMIKRQQINKQQCALFIDKNFPPQGGLNKIVDKLQQFQKRNRCRISILGVLPVSKSYVNRRNDEYPFSLQYLSACLIKGINRKDHSNLSGDELKTCSVIIGFYKMHKGFTFVEHKLKKFFNRWTRIDFGQPQGLNKQDYDLLEEVVDRAKGFDGHAKMPELLECLRKGTIKFPDIKEQARRVVNEILA